MADANVVSLQTAVNRFAASAGFSKLVVDGVMGAKTLTATQAALDFLSIETDDASDGLTPTMVAAAQSVRASTTSTTWLAAYAIQTATLLNQGANALGLPIVSSPVVTVPSVPTSSAAAGGVLPVIAAPVGVMASISNKWRGLDTWQKVAVGLIAGLSAMWAVHQFRTQRRAGLHGTRVRVRRGDGRASKSYWLVEA